VTRLDTFARVTRESREFGASGHCLIFSQIQQFNGDAFSNQKRIKFEKKQNFFFC
jgi:hypothetical protein